MEKCANITKAEEAARKAYPDNEVLFFVEDPEGNYQPVTEFGREINGFIFGYEQAEKDIIDLIESRIGKILGDAQPTPILRYELQDLIKKIKEEE